MPEIHFLSSCVQSKLQRESIISSQVKWCWKFHRLFLVYSIPCLLGSLKFVQAETCANKEVVFPFIFIYFDNTSILSSGLGINWTNRIMVSFRFEKTFKTIKFHCSLSTAKSVTSPGPQVPQIHIFKIPSRMVTPLLPWTAHASAWQPFQWRNISCYPRISLE